ncbi:MAG: carbon-nitrogen hydrolase family protein [Myxococcota bacterium]
MNVGIVQFRAPKGDKERALASLAWLAGRAAEGSDLVVLPEMAATGYLFPDRAAVEAVAEEAHGPTFRGLSAVARDHGCWLVAGFPERDADQLFNSALVIDPTGNLRFTYRKTLLYEADEHWATPGDTGYAAFDTDAGRFGVGICMDLNDDAFVRWMTGARLDALAFPTNWVHSEDLGVHTWVYWAWRMRGQRAALVAANTWGAEGSVRFTGESAVLRGEQPLVAMPATGNGAVRASLT